MSALEQEIFEKFQQFDQAAKQRVLTQLHAEVEQTRDQSISLDAWLGWADVFREQLRQKYGDNFYVNNAEVLNDVREERLRDLMVAKNAATFD